jgi:hypothetical protein
LIKISAFYYNEGRIPSTGSSNEKKNKEFRKIVRGRDRETKRR